jgi:hypothetical protein
MNRREFAPAGHLQRCDLSCTIGKGARQARDHLILLSLTIRAGVDMLIRSWGLFFACWQVLRSQPALVIYPIISGIASTLFVALFMIPLVVAGYFDDLFQRDMVTSSTTNYSGDETASVTASIIPDFLPWQTWAVLFVLGLVLNLITNFCNAAFTAATLIRLSGGEVSVGEAFTVAAARFPAIFGYSMIGATVGLVIRMIEERVGLIGKLIGAAVGIAWAVATFMVVPVLVVENVGPIEAIKRSMSLLRRTWGEGLICRVGIGAAAGLISMGFMLISAIVISAAWRFGNLPITVMAVLVAAIGLIAIGVISRTLSGIFMAALYAYATGRGTMPGIPAELITGAFGPKSSRL